MNKNGKDYFFDYSKQNKVSIHKFIFLLSFRTLEIKYPKERDKIIKKIMFGRYEINSIYSYLSDFLPNIEKCTYLLGLDLISSIKTSKFFVALSRFSNSFAS